MSDDDRAFLTERLNHPDPLGNQFAVAVGDRFDGLEYCLHTSPDHAPDF